jgi:hypothetical protein
LIDPASFPLERVIFLARSCLGAYDCSLTAEARQRRRRLAYTSASLRAWSPVKWVKLR